MIKQLHGISSQRIQLDMRLVCSRAIPFIDSHSLRAPARPRSSVSRKRSRFVLYLADGNSSSTSEERVIFLDLREAMAKTYHVYEIGPDGRRCAPPKFLRRSTDDAAVREARMLLDGRDLEIWQGSAL